MQAKRKMRTRKLERMSGVAYAKVYAPRQDPDQRGPRGKSKKA